MTADTEAAAIGSLTLISTVDPESMTADECRGEEKGALLILLGFTTTSTYDFTLLDWLLAYPDGTFAHSSASAPEYDPTGTEAELQTASVSAV